MATNTKKTDGIAAVACVCVGNVGASVSVCASSVFNSFHCVFFARFL